MSGSGKAEKLTPKILITNQVKLKQQRLVANCPDEIFWAGFVDTLEIDNVNYLRVHDIVLPQQVVSGGSVDIDDTFNELIEREADRIEQMHYFAHSHAHHGAFHSGVDVQQILDWGEKLELDWLISHIQNKRGETTTRFDQFHPFRMHVEEVALLELVSLEVDQWAKEQIKEYVSKKTYTSNSYAQGGSWSRSANGRQVGPMKRSDQQNVKGDASKFHIKWNESDKMYPDADEVMIVHREHLRSRIVDGYIREVENTLTGEYNVYREPTEMELDWDSRPEHKGVINSEQDLKSRRIHLDDSRSLARTTEKRVEGKAVALLTEGEGEQTQTQTPKTQGKNKGGKKSESKGSENDLRGIDPDKIYDEREAAQLLANIQEEQEEEDTQDDTQLDGEAWFMRMHGMSKEELEELMEGDVGALYAAGYYSALLD